MEDIKNKMIIELEPWEAEKMNTGLKYLIETHLKNPENVKVVSGDCLKAVSWLIAFRHYTFDEKPRQMLNTVSQEQINE